MSVIVPALFDGFDLEAEFEAAKARLPGLSGNRWTDTSNSDPGVVLLRAVFEEIQRWVYSGSARYIASDVILHLADLLGIVPNEATFAQGILVFTVAPGTTIQAGFRVADDVKGLVYATQTPVSSLTGGVVTVEARALVAGTGANTRDVGAIRGLRDTASVGQVLGVSNQSSFDGGGDAETVEAFKKRFPGLVQNTAVLRPAQFEARALSNGAVKRDKVYRATRPGSVTGQFVLEPDHTTLVLLGPGGAAPVQSVLDAVRDDVLANTIFNLYDPDPNLSGLHVIGARTRQIGVTGQIVAVTGANLATLKSDAQTAVIAYLDPLTGGATGAGFDFGRPPRLYEIGSVLEAVNGVDYVRDGTLVLSNATGMAIDEVIAPNTGVGAIDFTVAYS